MHNKQNTWPYRIYFNTTVIAVCIGAAISAYLIFLHYKTYTDFTYSSFCAISKSINCDTVAQSPWSVIADLPISVWGMFGYLFFLLVLSTLKNQSQTSYPTWSVLVVVGGIYSLLSLFLGFISSFKIHAYCILCLCIYSVNLFLFYISLIVRNRFSDRSFLKDLSFSPQQLFKNRIFIAGTGIIALLFFVTKFNLPHYWNFETSPTMTNLPTGITELGQPWIGAENPTLTIEEYTDYQCFQCAKTHFMLRRLTEKNPTRLRLVHRHYPMDQEFNPTVVQDDFHIGSGKMALLAVYSMTQNKFWQMNDALFQLARSKEPFNTRYLAEKTGIPSPELVEALSHPDIHKLLSLDIHRGMKLRITGTPSFVIDGKVFQGSIPLDILQKIQQ